MSNPDGDPGGKTASDVPVELTATVPDHAMNADVAVFHDDIQAGQILADILGGPGGAAGAMDDVHAALASIPDDTFLSLDNAVHHLTTSVDLFDVPTLHDGDGSDHSS